MVVESLNKRRIEAMLVNSDIEFIKNGTISGMLDKQGKVLTFDFVIINKERGFAMGAIDYSEGEYGFRGDSSLLWGASYDDLEVDYKAKKKYCSSTGFQYEIFDSNQESRIYELVRLFMYGISRQGEYQMDIYKLMHMFEGGLQEGYVDSEA